MKRFLVAYTVMWITSDGDIDAEETRYRVSYAATSEVASRRAMAAVALGDKAYSAHSGGTLRYSAILFAEGLSNRKIRALYDGYARTEKDWHYARQAKREGYISDAAFDAIARMDSSLGSILDAIEEG